MFLATDLLNGDANVFVCMGMGLLLGFSDRVLYIQIAVSSSVYPLAFECIFSFFFQSSLHTLTMDFPAPFTYFGGACRTGCWRLAQSYAGWWPVGVPSYKRSLLRGKDQGDSSHLA